eukprot:gene3573-13651_t
MNPADAAVPSNLTYRERIAFRKESVADYNRLYSAGASKSVWDRLCSDASHRKDMRRFRKQYNDPVHPAPAGPNASTQSQGLSGFTSNSHPAASYTPHTSFKTGHLEATAGRTPVETMHPIVAKRFKQREPIEFMATIRPDTETTNQTLRMMGTYQPDFEHAKKFNVHIPAGCPGGKPSYHPDVHLTWKNEKSSTMKAHKAWDMPPYGNNMKRTIS